MTAPSSCRPPTSPTPELVDRDGFLYAIEAGFGVRGAHISGNPELVTLFYEDMTAFWTEMLFSGHVTGATDLP